MINMHHAIVSVALFSLLSGCGANEPVTGGGAKILSDYSLREPVEIKIDDQGVPHLYAKSDLDLFLAAGYKEAEDALFVLEVTRRGANGELAEALGEGSLASDRQARLFELSHWGKASVKKMSAERPDDFNLIVAYVAGINRRVGEVLAGTAPLPEEFSRHQFSPERWTPDDVLAVGLALGLGFSSTFSFDLLKTLVDKLVPQSADLPIYRPYDDTFIVDAGSKPLWLGREAAANPHSPPPAQDRIALERLFAALEEFSEARGIGEGSNSWAVSGEFTESGFPMLANDSHQRLTDPNRLHLKHLDSKSAGGTFDVIGFSFTGVPSVQVGHNRKLAWGATTAFSDTMDVWAVEVTDGQALIGGSRVPVTSTFESIRVRNADGTIRDEAFELRRVGEHGVLVPEAVLPVPKPAITSGELMVGWPGFSVTSELAGFFAFNRAETLAEFEAAVDYQRTAMQNWLGATSEGLRYRVNGNVPDRGPVDGRARSNTVLDAADPSTLWTGAMLPKNQLPRLDGSQAFIVTANNDPWGHTADNDPLNDEFYYGSYFAPGFRASRITRTLRDLVDAQRRATRSAMQELQMDVTSSAALELVPLLAEAVAAIDTDPKLSDFAGRPELVSALTRLSAWDARMSLDSEEAALFRLFVTFFSRRTLADALGLLFDGLDEAQPVTVVKLAILTHKLKIASLLAGKERQMLVGALSDALAEHTRRATAAGGTYTWGDLHRGVFRKFDDLETLREIPGDDTTINVAQCRCWEGGKPAEYCRTTGGAAYRIIADFDADGTPAVTYNFPLGNAGDREHYFSGEYAPLRFRRTDVESATRERRTLDP